MFVPSRILGPFGWCALVALLLGPVVCGAQPAEDGKLRVAVSVIEPFVIVDKSTYTGVDVDLWRDVARELDLEYELVMMTQEEKLEAVTKKEVDVAIGGISITEERAGQMYYSIPYYVTGLSVMSERRAEGFFSSLVRAMVSPQVLTALGLLAVFIIVGGHVYWIVERRKTDAISESYNPGILEGMWLSFATSTTIGYGDIAPKHWMGRLVTIPVAFLGFMVVAMVTSVLTFDLITTYELNANDLRRMTVGVKSGTTSEELVVREGWRRERFEKIAQACEALERGDVDAVIHDAPFLRYYARTQSEGDLVVSSQHLSEEMYVFMFAEEDLARNVSVVLLRMKENGTIDNLKRNYLGD